MCPSVRPYTPKKNYLKEFINSVFTNWSLLTIAWSSFLTKQIGWPGSNIEQRKGYMHFQWLVFYCRFLYRINRWKQWNSSMTPKISSFDPKYLFTRKPYLIYNKTRIPSKGFTGFIIFVRIFLLHFSRLHSVTTVINLPSIPIISSGITVIEIYSKLPNNLYVCKIAELLVMQSHMKQRKANAYQNRITKLLN